MGNGEDHTLLRLLAGGIACGTSSWILNPADLIKVRMVTEAGLGQGRPLSFLETAAKIRAESGILTFWTRGVPASLIREMMYSSIRMGLYERTRAFFHADPTTEIGLVEKILAGATTGAIGSAIANPTDVVKTRLQAVTPTRPSPYRHTFHAFAAIYRNEGGLRGLYTGTTPTVVRAAVLTGSQLSMYDHFKSTVKANNWMDEGPKLHFSASIFAAIITVFVTNPVDFIKTKYITYNGSYTGPIDCLRQTIKLDGVLHLWRGSVPNFARLGPHFVISFPLLEFIRYHMGLEYL